MNNIRVGKLSLLLGSMLFILSLALSGCQAEPEPDPTLVETQMSIPENPTPGVPSTGGASPTRQAPPTATVESHETDPAIIQAAWQASPHADTFVLDASGQNNTCARCHAPVNWMPSMDELPESCFACKFELEAPPPLIPESDWTDIPCNVCHRIDKKKNILPEYAWLEIAPLDEYISVETVSELCLKCHAPVDIAGHGVIQVAGDHTGYECTQCHSAHDTSASCGTAGCHAEPDTPIPGHDENHKVVTCVACHDGGNMEVMPDQASGQWTTFINREIDTASGPFAFTSHNVVLEAKCDRCHYTNNPWELSVQPESP